MWAKTRCCVLAALSLAGALQARPGWAAGWYTGAEEVAGDALIVAIDNSVTISSQGAAFASSTITAPLAGTLTETGARVRLEGLGGTYDYRAGAQAIRGEQIEGAALVGHEWVWRDAALAGYVGLNLRDNTLSHPDPRNRVVGTALGFKGALDLYARPSDRTMVHLYGAYSTAHGAYYVRARTGIALPWGGYVGPEAAVLGDDFYNQWRVGAHLSALQLGPLQVGLAAGYLHDRVRKGGLYTAVDVRAAF